MESISGNISGFESQNDKSRNELNNVSDLKKNKSKRNSQIKLYDDIDIDKYMSLVEEELKKLGYSLESRTFIHNIVNILDKLIVANKFNKTIFFHILDVANLNRDSPVLLLDFFRSFFTVYESMKRNREIISSEILKDTQRIGNLQNKKLKLQSQEKILEDGLTNNSQIKIRIVNISADPNSYFDNASPISNSATLKFKFGNKTQNLETNSLNKKITFQLDSMSLIDNHLYLDLQQRQNEVFIDKFNIRNLLETPLTYKFTYQKINFELKLVWVNSKINFYSKEISRLESTINENKEAISVLNNCILHIEETFKSYFAKTDSAANGSDTKIVIGTMTKELEISQKIEDYVLHAVGKEIVKWDRIVYFLNKVMVPMFILVFYQRFDILTLFVCMSLFATEFRMVSSSHLYKILLCILCSILNDIIWILFNISNFGDSLPFDGNSTGSAIRQLSLVVSICSLILKLILAFSQWRLALEYKLKVINKQYSLKREFTINSNLKDSNKFDNLKKSNLKQSRPQLKSTGSNNLQIPLRMFEKQGDFNN